MASKKALKQAGLTKGTDDAFDKLDKTKVGVLVGSGMGGLTVFQVRSPLILSQNLPSCLQ